MPWGMPKNLDSPETNAKMEKCVTDVMAQGHDKVSAIKICKTAMIRSHKLRTMKQGGK